MAQIRPFAGIRPAPGAADAIAAPPYDVVDFKEACAIAARQPDTYLRVTRPEIDLGAGADEALVHETGRRNLQNLIERGQLIRDARPCFYLYEQRMGAHAQIAVLAGASLDEYGSGKIKRHENTRQRELDERTRHIDAMGHNTEPVFFVYRARPAIDALVEKHRRERAPTYDLVADDGVGHRVWVVEDAAEVARIERLFSEIPEMYVADGHHRTAASHQVQQLRRERNAKHAGTEAYNFLLAALFPHDQIQILPYNRVVLDLHGHTAEQLREALSTPFEIAPTASPQPTRPATFGMFLDGRWYRLTARPGTFPSQDPQRSLDAAILQENALAPLLGITNPRTDPRIRFIGGIRGTAELEARAAHGGVAFCLFAVSMEQIMRVADAGEVMPPKSTWFEPKPRSGLVVRSIDREPTAE